MKQVIWKYELDLTCNPRCTVRMPPAAQILTLQVQDHRPHIWALLTPEPTLWVDRNFVAIGTGHDIVPQPGVRLVYVGTYQISAYVWHVFEEVLY